MLFGRNNQMTKKPHQNKYILFSWALICFIFITGIVISIYVIKLLASRQPYPAQQIIQMLETASEQTNTATQEIFATVSNNDTTPTLTIGPTITKIPPTAVKTIYVVRSGDTLISIAEGFQIDYEAIMDANQLESDNISIGQELIIPIAILPVIVETPE